MTDVHVRPLQPSDPPVIAAAFEALGWDKPVAQYEEYLSEQDAGTRTVLVAWTSAQEFAGYLTVVWTSHYPPFADAGIPEVVDFNVLPHLRRRGIGARLMTEAEELIGQRSPIAGIGVALTADYGAAQALYAARGYVPDARGAIRDAQQIPHGTRVPIDDGTVLMLTRRLR